MTSVTELDVLKAAKEQIKAGYTNDHYITVDDRGRDYGPAEAVRLAERTGEPVMVCAVGGIEQAIWKLTGASVVRYRGLDKDKIEPKVFTNETRTLYRKVMVRLNLLARRLATTEDWVWQDGEYVLADLPRYACIEDINTSTHRAEENKPLVLKVIDQAIRQVQREMKNAH